MRQALVPYTLAVYTAFDALQLAAAHSLESHASIITTITTTTSTTSTITVYADQSTERPTSKTSSSSASSLPIAAFAAPSMAYTASLDDAVLNSTNLYRANYGADALTWNATLAAFAQTHAEKCIWQHSGGPFGENLAEGFATPADSIDAWAREERVYDWSHPRFSERTGHFTQLVWRDTTQVGCGAVQCDGGAGDAAKGWFLVCEYSPAGNVGGEYADEVMRAGKSDDGKLGLGGARGSSRSSRVLVAMAAAYLVLSLCA